MLGQITENVGGGVTIAENVGGVTTTGGVDICCKVDGCDPIVAALLMSGS